jgi:hypothetical protein
VPHRADVPAFDARAALTELRRQPPLPGVRRLDDVVVDTDDLRQGAEAEFGSGLVLNCGHGRASSMQLLTLPPV